MAADSAALLDDQKVVVNAPMSDIEKAGDPNVLAFSRYATTATSRRV